eukprot:m51a1_g9079 hypothetical protein (892) ;mRNA; f:18727-22050
MEAEGAAPAAAAAAAAPPEPQQPQQPAPEAAAEPASAPGARGTGETVREKRLRYLQASVLVEDAIAFRPVTHELTSEAALRVYRFFWKKNVQRLLNVLVLALLIIPVFEKPAFVVQADEDDSDSAGTSLLAPWPSTELVELAILLVVALADIAPRWKYSLPGTWRNRGEAWFLAYNAVVALSVVDVLVRLGVYGEHPQSGYFRFSRPLRVYLIVFRVESVRVTLRSIVATFFHVSHLFALFFTLIAVFAATGVLLFDGTPEQKTTFPDTLEGIYQLLILTTTVNHPDVYIPAYNYNWLSYLFFMLYTVVTQLFFLNLILSVIVSSWRDLLKSHVAARVVLRRETLRAAFSVLSRGAETMDREEFLGMARVYRPGWPEGRALFYWNSVDKDRAGSVTYEQFTYIIEALEITVAKVEGIWRLVPSRVSKRLRRLTRSAVFNHAVDFVIVVVSVWPIVEVELRHAGIETMTERQGNIIEFSFLAFFTLELLVKLVAERSLSLFLAPPKNKFDFWLLVASWIMSIISIAAGGRGGLVKISLTIRILRVLFSIIGGIKKFEWLFNALVDVVPTFASIILAHVTWMYLFSVLGVEIFGDVVRQAHAEGRDSGYGTVAATGYAQLNYWRIGYGSFPEALVASWLMVIVNNWHVLIDAYVVATGHKISRLFFICFWVIDVICTMAVLVAVLIEMVLRHYNNRDTRDDREKEAEQRVVSETEGSDSEGVYWSDAASPKRLKSPMGIREAAAAASGHSDESGPEAHGAAVKFGELSDIRKKKDTWISRRTKTFTTMIDKLVVADLNDGDFEKNQRKEMLTGLDAVLRNYEKKPAPVAAAAGDQQQQQPQPEAEQQQQQQQPSAAPEEAPAAPQEESEAPAAPAPAPAHASQLDGAPKEPQQ